MVQSPAFLKSLWLKTTIYLLLMLHVRHRLVTLFSVLFDPETHSDRAATVDTEAVTAEGKENMAKHTLAPKAPAWKCRPSLLSIFH